MAKPTSICRIIVRLDDQGTPIIFSLDETANPGRIVCYQHIGQHSEADLGYYREKTKPDHDGKCADLIKEYEGICDYAEPGCKVRILKRLPNNWPA